MVSDVKDILEKIDSNGIWAVKLLKIRSSNRAGLSYMAREIKFSPDEIVKNHIDELVERYVGKDNAIGKYTTVAEYDGTTDASTIYTLDSNNCLINEANILLMDALADADQESDPTKEKYSAYVIVGTVEEKRIYLFSMQSPFVNMKRKHVWDNSTFRRFTDPVLSLKLNIDVLIYDKKVYMFSMSGENLFNMDRAYKAVCTDCIIQIKQSGILLEDGLFENVASAGSNPRRFVSFNKHYLDLLKDKNVRKKIGKKFDIPMREGRFDTKQDGTADKIVKLLCKKGMLDPFDDIPVEVSGSKKWS